jgi:transcription elongation GreA/GreB family factor
MEKAFILRRIIESLSEDLAVLLKAAKTAHEASVHAENVPDNKYDTLSLEASYIAQGQANRAQEIKAAVEAYRKLSLQEFAEGCAIRLSALVTLEADDGTTKAVFIGPDAGGLKIEENGGEVTVITPNSPLGRELIGRVAGDVVEIRTAGTEMEFEIVEVR